MLHVTRTGSPNSRQSCLCLAHRRRAAGVDAWIRRDRSDAGESGAGRRGGAALAGGCTAQGRCRADPRHRAQSHGGRYAQRMVARHSTPGPVEWSRRVVRHRLGTTEDGPAKILLPASGIGHWRRSSKPASCRSCRTMKVGRNCALLRGCLPALRWQRRGPRQPCEPAGTATLPARLQGGWLAIASTGAASSTSTSWSACAWNDRKPSRRCIPCRCVSMPKA